MVVICVCIVEFECLELWLGMVYAQRDKNTSAPHLLAKLMNDTLVRVGVGKDCQRWEIEHMSHACV